MKYINKIPIIVFVVFFVTCTSGNKTKEVMNQRKYMYVIGTGLLSIFTQANAENTTSMVSIDIFPTHHECYMPSYIPIIGATGLFVWGCSMWGCYLYGKKIAKKNFIKPKIRILKSFNHDNELEMSPSSNRKIKSAIENNPPIIISNENDNIKRGKDPFSKLRNAEIVFYDINNNQSGHNSKSSSKDEDILEGIETIYEKIKKGDLKQEDNQNDLVVTRNYGKSILQNVITDKLVEVTNSHKMEEHEGNVVCVTLSPFSPEIALSCGKDKTVRIWNVNKQTSVILGTHDDIVFDVKFSPFDDDLIASSGRDGFIKLWGLKNKNLRKKLCIKESGGITSLDFSPSAKNLLLTGDTCSNVILWNLDIEEKVYIYGKHTSLIRSVIFSPINQYQIASGSKDMSIIIHDLEKRTHRAIYDSYEVRTLDFSSFNESLLLSGGKGKDIMLWDLRTNKPSVLKAHNNSVNVAKFSLLNSHQIFSGGVGRRILCWDIRTLKATMCLKGHIKSVGSLDISPFNEKNIISGSSDGRVRYWHLP